MIWWYWRYQKLALPRHYSWGQPHLFFGGDVTAAPENKFTRWSRVASGCPAATPSLYSPSEAFIFASESLYCSFASAAAVRFSLATSLSPTERAYSPRPHLRSAATSAGSSGLMNDLAMATMLSGLTSVQGIGSGP